MHKQNPDEPPKTDSNATTKSTRRFSTWSPFQSPVVRQICQNLTDEEYELLIDESRRGGKEVANWIASPFSLVVMTSVLIWQRMPYGSILLVSLWLVYMILLGIPRIQQIRQRKLEILCNSAFAVSRGYSPDTLRLERFPWQRPVHE